MAIITLTTDLGIKDYYVSAVKGSILKALDGNVTVVDISNTIKIFDIRNAAYTLKNSFENFPAGTIHIVGVDSGISASRPAILMEYKGHFFIHLKVGGGIFLLINNTLVERIVKNIAPKETNTFYHIPSSINRYSGKILRKKINFKSFINSFGFSLDSLATYQNGYSIGVESSIKSPILELDTNRIYKRSVIGGNLRGAIKMISINLKTPIEIKNIPNSMLTQKIDVSYYTNLTFTQNIEVINHNNNLHLVTNEKKIKCKNYFVK